MENEKLLPNFLIAGMAKCGTSSLSSYLQQHPDVFISKRKEPRFLTSQCMRFPMNGPKDHLVESWYVKNYDNYLKLFADARPDQAIGEASADTLYFHQGTIPVIKQYLGDPKILIILRNPINRAFSAYQHLVRDEREFISFEEGLEKEQERIDQNYELIYHYRKASMYYEPLKEFIQAFSQVKVILSEDLQKSPVSTHSEVFEFLGVDPAFEVENLMKLNVSGVPKNKFLQRAFQDDNVIRNAVRPLVRAVAPSVETRKKIFNWVTRKNLDRMSITPETRERLKEDFKEDIERTSKLIHRDLSRWLD
ncbi:MAG: sulfotransferase [Cytophagaceae bacterium]